MSELKEKLIKFYSHNGVIKKMLENPTKLTFARLRGMILPQHRGMLFKYMNECGVLDKQEEVTEVVEVEEIPIEKDAEETVDDIFTAEQREEMSQTTEGTENDETVHITVLNPEIAHDEDGNVIENSAEEVEPEEVAEQVEETVAESEDSAEEVAEQVEEKPKKRKKK